MFYDIGVEDLRGKIKNRMSFSDHFTTRVRVKIFLIEISFSYNVVEQVGEISEFRQCCRIGLCGRGVLLAVFVFYESIKILRLEGTRCVLCESYGFSGLLPCSNYV